MLVCQTYQINLYLLSDTDILCNLIILLFKNILFKYMHDFFFKLIKLIIIFYLKLISNNSLEASKCICEKHWNCHTTIGLYSAQVHLLIELLREM